jgi:hypothetical protein
MTPISWSLGPDSWSPILVLAPKKLVLPAIPFPGILPSHEGTRRTVHPFPAPLHFSHFISWMRHLLQGERNVPVTSRASRKDPEPCSPFTTHLPLNCAAASRPLAWGWAWCDCSRTQGGPRKPERHLPRSKTVSKTLRRPRLRRKSSSTRCRLFVWTTMHLAQNFVHLCSSESPHGRRVDIPSASSHSGAGARWWPSGFHRLISIQESRSLRSVRTYAPFTFLFSPVPSVSSAST